MAVLAYRRGREQSPSTRRAWIEITCGSQWRPAYAVALHPEGVDRNPKGFSLLDMWRPSPSTRRAWIEILLSRHSHRNSASPSTRRAWIEIGRSRCLGLGKLRSPSTRRAWIEIFCFTSCARLVWVALHPEGVDRNGRLRRICSLIGMSPSTRRAWIEIKIPQIRFCIHGSRPPPGGRG